MSVTVFLITHSEVGKALHHTAKRMFGGKLSLPIRVMSVSCEINPVTAASRIKRSVEASSEQGVLILTDLYGSTPCNLVRRLLQNKKVAVVTGLNLPMLVRVLNYPRLSLVQLVQKAVSGGREGVVRCTQRAPANKTKVNIHAKKKSAHTK